MRTLSEYIKTTVEEHDSLIKSMSEGLHNDDPKVGIFWWNDTRQELFGVIALSLNDEGVSNTPDGKTCKILHKKVWEKEYRRLKWKEKKENTFPFIGDYKDKPRGRIFYKDNVFYLYVGDWINDIKNSDKFFDEIEKTFDLTNETIEVKEDHHWNIGEGWENM